MRATTKMLAVVAAIVMSIGNSVDAEEKGLPEFEGRVRRKDGTLHYSYVFLPSVRVIIELDYGADGKVTGIAHGSYTMAKNKPISIRWQSGATERGEFSGRQYRITRHTDTSQVNAVSVGGWRRLTDPTRTKYVAAYVQKVVAPLLRQRTALNQQLRDLEHMQFQSSMRIAEMWLKD